MSWLLISIGQRMSHDEARVGEDQILPPFTECPGILMIIADFQRSYCGDQVDSWEQSSRLTHTKSKSPTSNHSPKVALHKLSKEGFYQKSRALLSHSLFSMMTVPLRLPRTFDFVWQTQGQNMMVFTSNFTSLTTWTPNFRPSSFAQTLNNRSLTWLPVASHFVFGNSCGSTRDSLKNAENTETAEIRGPELLQHVKGREIRKNLETSL